ncbi:MAG: hypothetical protein EOP45_00445 [Sphingobacteriaceae bacterium]|nr:MAG: hypothetical protein EOP45_00445 [Sphingobacteriaceae bacterium]
MEELYVLPYGQMSLWGFFDCPTWSQASIECMSLIPFIAPKVRAVKRIGPHNIDILSVLIGSLLGDSSAEQHGDGTRFCFQQEGSHSAYLVWFHTRVAGLGYCTPNIPNTLTRLGVNGKIRQVLRFKTFTYTSFNWVLEAFYIQRDKRRVKIVPALVEHYLTPLALAVWIMDDGGATQYGLKIASNSFTLRDTQLLCDILNRKYNLEAKPHSAGYTDQYVVYIPSRCMPTLANIVGPHMHPSMYYKLGRHLPVQN